MKLKMMRKILVNAWHIDRTKKKQRISLRGMDEGH